MKKGVEEELSKTLMDMYLKGAIGFSDTLIESFTEMKKKLPGKLTLDEIIECIESAKKLLGGGE